MQPKTQIFNLKFTVLILAFLILMLFFRLFYKLEIRNHGIKASCINATHFTKILWKVFLILHLILFQFFEKPKCFLKTLVGKFYTFPFFLYGYNILHNCNNLLKWLKQYCLNLWRNQEFSMGGRSLGVKPLTAWGHWGSWGKASSRGGRGLGAKPPALGEFCNFSI